MQTVCYSYRVATARILQQLLLLDRALKTTATARQQEYYSQDNANSVL